MSSYNLEDLFDVVPSSSLSYKVVTGQNSTLLLAKIAKGGKVPRHRHPHEQISYILKGKINASIFGDAPREYAVGEGEVSVIPPNVEHELSALEDTILIDFFSPRRDDLAKYSRLASEGSP
jgi:quercetin dioxygenase-like cupin family protein